MEYSQCYLARGTVLISRVRILLKLIEDLKSILSCGFTVVLFCCVFFQAIR